MQKITAVMLIFLLIFPCFLGCQQPSEEVYEGTRILLADNGITVDDSAISTDTDAAVYAANDIVYYEEGHDFTYGEGTEEDAHSPKEAAAHTVVHITKAGTYIISGKLSAGQIAVDLGEDAKQDPKAVVTLVLMSVDITCTVAPAIIFYNVYECGSKDADDASAEVDTGNAGANIILPSDTVSTIRGSYVAKIYKPGSVELNKDGTEVADAKKLHKYDGALYSKMSMNISGGFSGNGRLNIYAANEGISTELHLTIKSGDIHVESGNDGINTNEDGVSVTTINGGTLNIRVTGATGEGDGIDSNGWLVINGGHVFAQACGTSMDAGIDSDMGIHINGGTVFATGNMLDRIAESRQNYAVFQMAQSVKGGFTLKDSLDNPVMQQDIKNSFTYLVLSYPGMTSGAYTLWQDGSQLQGVVSQSMAGQGPGGMPPPDAMEPPAGGQQPPDSMTPPAGGQQPPEPPAGMPPEQRPNGGGDFGVTGELSNEFVIKDGGNYFIAVQKAP